MNENSPFASNITPVKLLNVFKACDNEQSSNGPTPSPCALPFISKLGTTPKQVINKDKGPNNTSNYSLRNFNSLWNQTSVGAFGNSNVIDSRSSTKRGNAVPIKNMIISPNLIRAGTKPISGL